MKALKAWSDKSLLLSWKEAEARGLRMGEWARENRLPIYTTIPRLTDLLESGKVKHQPFDIETHTRWTLDWPSVMIVGDVQVPTTDWKLARLVAYVAERRMTKPRRLIIAGDFLNFDAWSAFPRCLMPAAWKVEREEAHDLLSLWLKTFDDIRWLFGNHERRKLYAAQAEEDEFDILNALHIPDERIKVSLFDRCQVNTPHGPWIVAHGGDYSQSLLSKADVYSQKFQSHVAAAHSHRFGLGVDKFGRYLIVSTGGLFDVDKLAYVQLTTTAQPVMTQGFLLINEGYPELFSPIMTNWDAI